MRHIVYRSIAAHKAGEAPLASWDDGEWWADVPTWMGAREVAYEGKWPLRCHDGEWEAVTVGEGYSPVGPLVQRALDGDLFECQPLPTSEGGV